MERLIQIKGLSIMAHIGVPDEERATPQRILLDLKFVALSQPQELEDDLSLTVDYAAVSTFLEKNCQAHPWHLLETLADKITTRLLTVFPLRWVELTIRKFVIPNAESVSVTVHREASYSV